MGLLATVNKMTAVDVFKKGSPKAIMDNIEKDILSVVSDVSTKKGRDAIAANSYRASTQKTIVDKMRKGLIKDWQDKTKAVNSDWAMMRDKFDEIRDEARKPLTEWEESEKARIESERLAKEILEAHEHAINEDDLYNRQKEIERKEAEQLKIEADRVAKEEADRIEKDRIERDVRLEKERIDREERLKLEAAETARIDAENKAAKEKAEAEQKVIDAKTATELEKLKAIQAAEKAEHDKIQAVREAELKASKVAAKKESDRLAKEAAEAVENNRLKAIEEKKATNKRHQASINNKILKKLSGLGISESDGKLIITAIAKLEIDYVTINY